MKKKYIFISTVILISLMVAGGSMAWFMDSKEATNEFKMGTVEVDVSEPGFKKVEGAEENIVYPKIVKVISKGTKKTYIRVRLIPEWDDPSLPVSNVELVLADNGNWLDRRQEDGYFYFKYYLTQGQETSPLLADVRFTELGPEYKGKTFTLKVVAEGVQITHDAWRYVWGLNKLPFDANEPWKPQEIP